MDRRARHREVPGPLEARWVPALLACLTLGILGVAWDAPARSAAALTGLAVAAAAVLGAARSTGRIRGVASSEGSRNATRQWPTRLYIAACNHISIGGLSE